MRTNDRENRAQTTCDVSFGRPNWAPGIFLFLFYTKLILLFVLGATKTTIGYERWAGTGRATGKTGERGPNNTLCVVWAPGMLLYIYI
jgi:hypothetical protein